MMVSTPIRRLVVTCFLAAGLIGSAGALEWNGEVSAGLGLTNNVELAPSGEEQSEGIMRVAPSLNIYHETQRIDFAFEGTLEGLFYRDDSNRNEANTQIFSSLLVDIIDERLGWRGLGSLAQVNISPDGPTPNTNLFDIQNRDDALTWETGPEWTSPIFSQSELRAVGYAGQIDFGDSSLQDIDTQYAEVSITQDPQAIGSIGHEARYVFQRFDYDQSGDIEDQSAFLRLFYQWSQSLRLLGLVGADNDFEEPGSSSLDQFRWELGFATELGPSDTLEAAIGERFFGTTWRATWNRIRENQRYRINYREEPANTDFLSARSLRSGDDPDGLDPPPIDDTRPGINDRFILRRLDALAQFDLPRSSLFFDAFWEKRDRENDNAVSDENPTGSQTGDEELWGFSGRFNYQLGNRTTARAGAFFRNRDTDRFDAGGDAAGSTDDDLYRITAGLDYELGVKTALALTVLYEERDFSGDGADYDQFGGLIEIIRRFGDLGLER